MERFPNKRVQKQGETIQSWRAPENELDTAVGKFLDLTKHDGVERKDAFEKVTDGWGSKKIQNFLDRLSVTEKGVVSDAVSVETRKQEKKAELFNEEKVVAALRAFKDRAVDGTSDMPMTFDEVAKDMQLRPGDTNELARRIMGMFTKHDLPEESTDEADVEQTAVPLTPEEAALLNTEDVPLSKRTRLIPQETEI